MAAAVLHCKNDSVDCGMAYRAGDPHHLSCRPPGDDAQQQLPLLCHLIIKHVAHARPGGNHHLQEGKATGVSPPPHHNWQQQQVSNNQLTEKTTMVAYRLCHIMWDTKLGRNVLCGILWCGREARGTAVGGLHRPRWARGMAETIANWFWLPSDWMQNTLEKLPPLLSCNAND